MKEKRKSMRVGVSLSLEIEGKGSFKIKNISRDGIFVLLNKGTNYNIGRYQKIQINLPFKHKKWVVSGETEFMGYRYCEPMGFALRINKIDEDYITFYNKLCRGTAERSAAVS